MGALFSVSTTAHCYITYDNMRISTSCVMDRFTSASGKTKPSTVRAAVGRSSTEMGAMRYLLPLWSALLSATSGENALGKGTVTETGSGKPSLGSRRQLHEKWQGLAAAFSRAHVGMV